MPGRITSQIPLLLDTADLSSEISSRGLQYFSSGAILGSIGGAILIGWFGSRYTGTVLAAYYFNMEPMPSVSTFFRFMAIVIVITVVSFYLIPSHIPRNRNNDELEVKSGLEKTAVPAKN